MTKGEKITEKTEEGTYYDKNQTCTSLPPVYASSSHTLNVRAANYSNNNVRVQMIDYNNGATVYSATMYSDGNSISVMLNNVYSMYYIKLSCLESWPWNKDCQAYGTISN